MSNLTLARFERALAASLAALPAENRPRRLCVGLSGGLDSSVLLVALAELALARPGQWSIRAIHVDHAIHADSPRWGRVSRQLAESLGVPIEDVRVEAGAAPGESPEAAARDARYAAFRRQLAPGEVLLTAHHADDQLETILLQWLRGGGLRAVAGMSPFAPLGTHAWHARPLLDFDRAALERFAGERGLAWVEDPSNRDLRFDRNYLRHAVLPALQRRWPAAAHTAGRVAEFARDALRLEAEVAAQDLARVRHGCALELDALLALPEARQRAVLRAWLAALGLPAPAAATLAALRRDVAEAAADRNPRTGWAGAVVHRYRGHLHAEADRSMSIAQGEWHGPTDGRFAWSPDWALELQPDLGFGLSRARLPMRLQVARRQGGEQFRPSGGAHRRPLRKWLQEHDVLPWRREHLPLLLDQTGRIVAVADLGYAHEYAAEPDEPSWRLAWQGRGIVTQPDAFGFKWPEDTTIR